MDYKLIFVILLIGHLLGYFYFQPQWMVERENKEGRATLWHELIYPAFIILPFLLLFTAPWAVWGLILLVSLLRVVFNIVKGQYISQKPFFKERPLLMFAVYQAIHILALLSIARFYATCNTVAYSVIGACLKEFYTSLHLDLSACELIRLVCLFLFLGEPVNVIVRKIIKTTTGKIDSNQSAGDQKAGRVVGVLERYLTAILIILEQYTAVGFAFTAKSVTRFSKISKDQDFAEQYLIGTMSSLLFTLIGVILYR